MNQLSLEPEFERTSIRVRAVVDGKVRFFGETRTHGKREAVVDLMAVMSAAPGTPTRMLRCGCADSSCSEFNGGFQVEAGATSGTTRWSSADFEPPLSFEFHTAELAAEAVRCTEAIHHHVDRHGERPYRFFPPENRQLVVTQVPSIATTAKYAVRSVVFLGAVALASAAAIWAASQVL